MIMVIYRENHPHYFSNIFPLIHLFSRIKYPSVLNNVVLRIYTRSQCKLKTTVMRTMAHSRFCLFPQQLFSRFQVFIASVCISKQPSGTRVFFIKHRLYIPRFSTAVIKAILLLNHNSQCKYTHKTCRLPLLEYLHWTCGTL